MNKDELKSILEQHELWFKNTGGKHADLRGADLQGADLRDADLRDADLRWANFQRADLRWANFQHADLRDADLRWANFQHADLRGANLRDADLRDADLRWANFQHADLRGANLDYSCLPLWCGSKRMKVDKRIASQIAAHFCALDCDDADYQTARTAILEFARMSHRADDLGLVVEREE